MLEDLIAQVNQIMAKKSGRKECCQHLTGQHQYCEIYEKSLQKNLR